MKVENNNRKGSENADEKSTNKVSNTSEERMVTAEKGPIAIKILPENRTLVLGKLTGRYLRELP